MWVEVFFQVDSNTITVTSQNKECLNWIRRITESHIKTLDYGKVEQVAGGLNIGGLKDSNDAVKFASYLMQDLLSYGWEHLNHDYYETGHWLRTTDTSMDLILNPQSRPHA